MDCAHPYSSMTLVSLFSKYSANYGAILLTPFEQRQHANLLIEFANYRWTSS